MKAEELDFTKSPDGLIPVIIQDDRTLKVLMLGYMNRDAFEHSMKTGKVTFFSRSRQKLWTKGETSGNFLHIVSVKKDCDADTLLVRVIPDGPVCHRGTVSCFDADGSEGDAEGFIRYLQSVVQQRHRDMPSGSYTTHLFNNGVNKIAQKVGEEAVETVIEAVDGNVERFVYESSDLIYHLLVLVEQMGCSLADLEKELKLRHK